MEKERERREIKTSQRAGARLRAGKGVRARGSLSQALIMGGRAGAEGSLFEVCGEKHQRERREASRAGGGGETQEGPPSARAHLDLPVSTPCPAQPPAPCHPSAQDWPEVRPPGHQPGAQAPANPCCLLSIPRGRAGFWPQGLPGLGRGRLPLWLLQLSPPYLPKKYVLASFGPPTFGILR